MQLDKGLYMVQKKKKDMYDFFIKSVVSGRKGLWMTKSNPIELRSKHGFVSTVIIDLNEYIVSSEGKHRFESSLLQLVEQFLERYQSMVILLEDVEALVDEESKDLYDLVKQVIEMFLEKNIVFIIALDGTSDESKTKVLRNEYGFITL